MTIFKTAILTVLTSVGLTLPGAENLINVTWGDNIMVGSGKADATASGIEKRCILVPEFSQGKFGQALDLTRID